jgi:MFS transporter, Spinster family, sphingosine-1-phosphate transporter
MRHPFLPALTACIMKATLDSVVARTNFLDDEKDTAMTSATSARTGATERTASGARYIMVLLFLGNLLNFFDRQMPSVVLGEIEKTFHVDDAVAGLLASAFVLVAALGGIPLGWLADRYTRKGVAGWALIVWSLFTALGGVFGGILPVAAIGLVPAFWIFFVSRVGVGIGEAGYSPATGSLISDLYPSERRSRANALFMLGFPVGLLLAFFATGALAVALGGWQRVFLVAAVPGVVVGILLLFVREPERGAAEPVAAAAARVSRSFGSIFRVRSIWGLIVAFAGYNFAAYAIGTFITVVLQRAFGLELIPAGALSGVVIGVSGLIGLLVGGRVLDRAVRRSHATRVRLTAVLLVAAAVLSLIGLSSGSLVVFVVFVFAGYLVGIVYLAASAPAISDVVEPRTRSTALGVVYAIGLLIGGAGGPIVAGAVSDSIGSLQTALMIVVPAAFAVAGCGMLLAARTFDRDRDRMLATEQGDREDKGEGVAE